MTTPADAQGAPQADGGAETRPPGLASDADAILGDKEKGTSRIGSGGPSGAAKGLGTRCGRLTTRARGVIVPTYSSDFRQGTCVRPFGHPEPCDLEHGSPVAFVARTFAEAEAAEEKDRLEFVNRTFKESDARMEKARKDQLPLKLRALGEEISANASALIRENEVLKTSLRSHEETAQALTLKLESLTIENEDLKLHRARESKLSGEYLKLDNELVAARNQITALQQKCLMERDAHDKDGKALLVCQKQLAEEREAHKTLRLRDARSWSLELLDALSKRVEELESKLSFEQRIPELVEDAIAQLNRRMEKLEEPPSGYKR